MIETKNQYNFKGLRDGYWEVYYSNGKIYCKGNYINGARDGYWEVYFYNGKLRESIFYDNN